MASQGHRRSALACLAARTYAAPRRPVRQGGLPLKSRRGPRQKVIGQASAKARFACGGMGIAVAEAKHATGRETPRHLEFQGLSLRDECHTSYWTIRLGCPRRCTGQFHQRVQRVDLFRVTSIRAGMQALSSVLLPRRNDVLLTLPIRLNVSDDVGSHRNAGLAAHNLHQDPDALLRSHRLDRA